jgi:hypothetical protein
LKDDEEQTGPKKRRTRQPFEDWEQECILTLMGQLPRTNINNHYAYIAKALAEKKNKGRTGTDICNWYRNYMKREKKKEKKK